MTSVVTLNVPLSVQIKIGRDWQNMHEPRR
jgi:DNA polymerase I-like protein with 3'-5' exonuclease and polymerase domains